jgi:uncharacterized protein (DUF1778 family)
MSTAPDAKPARLNIRVSQHEKEVLTQAAKVANTTVGSFVLQKAYAEAQSVLAEQNRFSLPEKQWRKFVDALDAPPKDIPQLRKLLTEPGIFDG